MRQRQERYAVRQITLCTRAWSLRLAPTSIRPTEVVEALDTLEWPEHGGQEQLCVPLVPENTFWYLSAVPELLFLASERLERPEEARP
jgi:hypothetical protein